MGGSTGGWVTYLDIQTRSACGDGVRKTGGRGIIGEFIQLVAEEHVIEPMEDD